MPQPREHLLRSGTRRFTCVYYRAGQSRPYADTIYEFDIISEWVPYGKGPQTWEPADIDEKLIINAAKGIGHSWDDEPKWPGPSLVSKTKIGPGHWKFVVKEEYTD